jgi:hypothetical protein
MADQLRNAPGVKSVELAPECDWPNDNMWEGGVSVIVEIDEKALGISIKDISDLMWHGDPHIDITRSSLMLAPWGRLQMFGHGLRDGEAELVVSRLKQVLSRKAEQQLRNS